MRIISIDPGYERLGIAVIEKGQNKHSILFSECFKTKATFPHHKRLELIGARVREVIEKYKPEALAIENLFFTANQKTAMKVAEARGVLLYEASLGNLEVSEFSPPQIKLAVAGNGRADKKSVIKMVELLTDARNIRHDDEYDAIAIGLTYLSMANRPK